MEYLVVNQSELPIVDGVRVCEGRGLEETNISVIFVDLPPGSGPRLHRHPYKEVFVVLEGQVRFTIGTTLIDVARGQIVMIAAGIPHKFVNSGEERLLQMDIHLNSEFETEWLET
jgi:mannose-6-phosphate isomerase-like protein (cupin superfamily)